MKIVVDIFGADTPLEIIKGCVLSLKYQGFELILSGDRQIIESELKKYKYDQKRIEFLDCKQVITNDMKPTDAIRDCKDSSLVKALDLLKNDDSVEGMISAGNTGAVLVGGTFRVGRIQGIDRPALAPLLPTVNDGRVCLVDCGANVDCKSEYLLQFGLLGSCYMSAMCGIANPRIGLVSNGTEDKKGNEQTKAAFELLKSSGLNFVGNLEARDALSGDFDVIVCDGFVGNVLLKSVEGTAKFVMTKLKETLLGGGLKSKIGTLLIKDKLLALKEKMNYHAFGGAPLLGLQKVLVKSHGSSDADAIAISIAQVNKMIKNKMIESIVNSPLIANQTPNSKDNQAD